MDAMKHALKQVGAEERAAAVVELVEKTLGFPIGLTEITEAAMSLSDDNRLLLAQAMAATVGRRVV